MVVARIVLPLPARPLTIRLTPWRYPSPPNISSMRATPVLTRRIEAW